MDCIFCKIVNGDIPCLKIYENDYVLSFLDINPDSDGHSLIIPKKHYTDLDDIDIETLSEINKASKIVKKMLEDKLHCNGISLLQNNGDVQEVKHYHMHIKPYYNIIKTIDMIRYKDKLSDPKTIYEKLK